MSRHGSHAFTIAAVTLVGEPGMQALVDAMTPADIGAVPHRRSSRPRPHSRTGPFLEGAKSMTTQTAKTYRKAPLTTPTNLSANAVRDLSGALTTLLADFFALYLKTKNFHWHISGHHF